MKDFAIRGGAVGVHVLLKSSVALGFDMTRQETGTVQLEKRLKEISTAMVHDSLNLIVAWVLPEALVVKVGFVKLDRTTVVAKHELLEGHEAHVPGITFLIGHKSGDLSWRLEHGTDFELPDAAVNISESHEGGPVLEDLRLG